MSVAVGRSLRLPEGELSNAFIDHRTRGRAVARENAARRSGGWFDPDVVAGFLDVSGELLDAIETESVWDVGYSPVIPSSCSACSAPAIGWSPGSSSPS